MIAHNLCYSTIVLDHKYEDIPGVQYDTFEIGNKTVKFAQNAPSLLPEILKELKAFRKQAKRDMAQATGSMKQVYNGKQLAYKISMNSVYGFTGAGRGMLPCVEIAATVTAEGRNMIEQTKELVEREFPGSKVRYGDTDSVMVEFPTSGTGVDAVAESWKLGEKAAEMCNAMFRHPKNLELEKVYWPYILYSKKRYAAKLWTMESDTPTMNYIDVKGLQLVRRDNTPYVREVSKDVLDIILDADDPRPAIDLCKMRAKELLDGKVPMDKLILSQKLADSYKNNNLAHVRVRDLIQQREPGSEPKSGDRVQYVLCCTDKKAATMGDRAEDPRWAEKHGLALDYQYYFTNKFMKPMTDLMEPLLNGTEIFQEFCKPKRKKKEEAPASNTTIDVLFSNRAKKLLEGK
jgi:DNA polymerase delta subunit 1